MDHTLEFCELTWHTPVASLRAKHNLLAWAAGMLEHIKAHSILRDIGVKIVKVERENGAASVRAILKSGDEFRQYAKHSQSLARKARRGAGTSHGDWISRSSCRVGCGGVARQK
ncbi:hypothetical protein [Bordetella trematum]|uniref:hypothetical protein n=1 Tax=Bordetella trematum TaxID=123899 RepID=UPI0013000D77|nr:hypothetical protein [Bordetella trematum]